MSSVYTGTFRPEQVLSALACLDLTVFLLPCVMGTESFVYTGTFRRDHVLSIMCHGVLMCSVYTDTFRPECVLSMLGHLDQTMFCLH